MEIFKIILIAVALWNAVTFALMGIDKAYAKRNHRRIRERTLLTGAFLMGGIGAILGALVFHHKTRKTRFRIGLPLALLVNGVLFILLMNAAVIGTAGGDLKYVEKGEGISGETAAELREFDADCALVLGCGVYADGTPTPMLRDRLEVGIELYEEGIVPKVLLSGDNGQENYNEIHTMFTYCLDRGIPREDLFCDHAGFSTYDSVYRAESIFEVERMIVVTQKYHEFRALYIAREKDIAAVGVSSDQERYAGFLYREGREVLARGKDLIKTALDLPPVFGGETIPITGSGAPSQTE